MLGGSRFIAFGLVVLLLGACLPGPAAAAEGTVLIGMSQNSAQALMDAGAKPQLGSYWVGLWMASSGWGGLENALRSAISVGNTPVIYWYYWGDSITPTCVENGCDGRSKEQWVSMTATLAQKIDQIMQGRDTIVVLENEFNKGGITAMTYAPTFDAYLAARATQLKEVDGVRVALGFGGWGEDSWGRFPKAIEASDIIGFQAMRASTKDTEAVYRGVVDRIGTLIAAA